MGGDQPQQATSTTSTVNQYSPEETARRSKVMDRAEGIYDRQLPQWDSMLNPAAKPIGASANTL